MRLSVVIPAYNEEDFLGEAIDSIKGSIEKTTIDSYEIIVSDDDSTDGTAEIAKEHGASVVRSGKRNIGATRNKGASQAQGEYLLFVDADSLVPPQVMQELEAAMEEECIGGGALMQWSQPANFLSNFSLRFWTWISKRFTLPAGSFFFVRREAFEQVQGFDEELYVSEELHLAKKLKRLGSLKILPSKISTSPRKEYQFSMWEFIKLLFFAMLFPKRTLRTRKYLKIWYERRK